MASGLIEAFHTLDNNIESCQPLVQILVQPLLACCWTSSTVCSELRIEVLSVWARFHGNLCMEHSTSISCDEESKAYSKDALDHEVVKLL